MHALMLITGVLFMNQAYAQQIGFDGDAASLSGWQQRVTGRGVARWTALSGAGAVGLWTKADSVTVFDDFSYASQR